MISPEIARAVMQFMNKVFVKLGLRSIRTPVFQNDDAVVPLLMGSIQFPFDKSHEDHPLSLQQVRLLLASSWFFLFVDLWLSNDINSKNNNDSRNDVNNNKGRKSGDEAIG